MKHLTVAHAHRRRGQYVYPRITPAGQQLCPVVRIARAGRKYRVWYRAPHGIIERTASPTNYVFIEEM